MRPSGAGAATRGCWCPAGPPCPSIGMHTPSCCCRAQHQCSKHPLLCRWLLQGVELHVSPMDTAFVVEELEERDMKKGGKK